MNKLVVRRKDAWGWYLILPNILYVLFFVPTVIQKWLQYGRVPSPSMLGTLGTLLIVIYLGVSWIVRPYFVVHRNKLTIYTAFIVFNRTYHFASRSDLHLDAGKVILSSDGNSRTIPVWPQIAREADWVRFVRWIRSGRSSVRSVVPRSKTKGSTHSER